MKSERLTVCHIISGDLWAGAEVMAFHLLNSLNSLPELKVVAIVLNEGRLATEIRNMGMEIHVIDEKTNSFPDLFLKILRLLKKRSVAIIHTHRYKENILSFLLSIVLRKPKLIATLHGMPEFQGNRLSAHRLINRLNFILLAHFFHRIVAVSREMHKTLDACHGFKNNSVCVIHNGIPIPEKHHSNSEKPYFTIGSSGRLFPVKDYRLFIAIACLLKSKSNIRFRLAGDGIEHEMLSSLVKDHHLENIFEMTGHIEDMNSFYDSLDLYVNTSLHEGIPMTILEAMSHGIPIIAPCIGGIPEIIENGIEGFIIQGRSAEDFAEKCAFLHENNLLYSKISGAARSRVEKEFSSQIMAKQYFVAYNGIIK